MPDLCIDRKHADILEKGPRACFREAGVLADRDLNIDAVAGQNQSGPAVVLDDMHGNHAVALGNLIGRLERVA